MTFHKSDCTEYMQSRHKLSKEMLQTAVEYFQSIHETRENDGSLQPHWIKKIWVEAKRKLRRKLEEQHAHKIRHISDQLRSYRLYDWRNNGHHCCCHYGWCKQHRLRNDGSHGNNMRDNRKRVPERKDKGFKPCCIHGKHAKHSYKECRANLRNQAHQKPRTNNNNKRRHKSHYNNNRYTSSNDESSGSVHTPMPSNWTLARAARAKPRRIFT